MLGKENTESKKKMVLVSVLNNVAHQVTATPDCSAALTGVSAWIEKLTALQDLLVMLSAMEMLHPLTLAHHQHVVNALELNSAKLDKCLNATTVNILASNNTTLLLQNATSFALTKETATTS